MIVFAFFLALVEVYLFSQLNFWGSVPLLFLVAAYTLRWRVDSIEMLASAAVYGFIVSLFMPFAYGFIVFCSFMFATLAIRVAQRVVHGTRLRVVLKGYDAVITAFIFTFAYWLAPLLYSYGSVATAAALVYVLLSMMGSLVLMLLVDVLSKRLAVR